jgi:hypothetical protein
VSGSAIDWLESPIEISEEIAQNLAGRGMVQSTG